MKHLLLLVCCFCITATLYAQKYPEPEFSNEVWYLKKDSTHSLTRLEKGNSKMENKLKAVGFGGSESGYNLEGERSAVRLASGNLSFIYSTGASASPSSFNTDSMMRANGIDPSAMQSIASMNDPANTINLYKAESGKGMRKVFVLKAPGMISFSKKTKSSAKYTFSVKKVRAGYWELMVDKPLPKGEYIFTMLGGMAMDGGIDLFAFGID